jgi:hypothetical protein
LLEVFFAIMSTRNGVLQAAAPFDTYSDAKEPLIAASADDSEKEDQGLEERAISSFKISSLLLGLLISFFFHFSALGASCLAMGNGWVDVKSTINIVRFSLLSNLFTLTTLVLMLLFIRHLAVTIAYSAVGGGRSKESLQDMIWQLQFHFGVGTVAGACLAWTVLDPLTLCSLAIMVGVVLYWYKATMLASAATHHSKPSSTRPSTAKQTTMMIV